MSGLPLHPRLRLDIRTHGRRLTVVGKKDALAELEVALQRLIRDERDAATMDSNVSESCPVRILYTNYRGETRWRSVLFTQIRWGVSPWHPVKQWLLEGIDMESKKERTFALLGIEKIGYLDRPAQGTDPSKATTFTHDLPNDLEQVLERLRDCDGKKSDAAVIVWERCQALMAHIGTLQATIESLAKRVADQSELLTRRAENEDA